MACCHGANENSSAIEVISFHWIDDMVIDQGTLGNVSQGKRQRTVGGYQISNLCNTCNPSRLSINYKEQDICFGFGLHLCSFAGFCPFADTKLRIEVSNTGCLQSRYCYISPPGSPPTGTTKKNLLFHAPSTADLSVILQQDGSNKQIRKTTKTQRAQRFFLILCAFCALCVFVVFLL